MALERLRLPHLVVDGDDWYSCLASGRCLNDEDGTECNCDALKINAYIEKLEKMVQATPPSEQRLKDVTCPQCRAAFRLTWEDWTEKPQTLFMIGCPSGGIYNVFIKCPHCNYEEEL